MGCGENAQLLSFGWLMECPGCCTYIESVSFFECPLRWIQNCRWIQDQNHSTKLQYNLLRRRKKELAHDREDFCEAGDVMASTSVTSIASVTSATSWPRNGMLAATAGNHRSFASLQNYSLLPLLSLQAANLQWRAWLRWSVGSIFKIRSLHQANNQAHPFATQIAHAVEQFFKN